MIAGEAFIASFETQESLVCLRVPKNGVAEIGALEVGQGGEALELAPGRGQLRRVTAPDNGCRLMLAPGFEKIGTSSETSFDV